MSRRNEYDCREKKRAKSSIHHPSFSSSPSLIVKPSSIAAENSNAPIGLGLFVTNGHVYQEGDFIVSFNNPIQVLTHTELRAMTNDDPRRGYILQITKDVFWDLLPSARSKKLFTVKPPDGVFVNAFHGAHFLNIENATVLPSKNCRIAVNARELSGSTTAKIYATKTIDSSSGDVELLTSYGAAYWK